MRVGPRLAPDEWLTVLATAYMLTLDRTPCLIIVRLAVDFREWEIISSYRRRNYCVLCTVTLSGCRVSLKACIPQS